MLPIESLLLDINRAIDNSISDPLRPDMHIDSSALMSIVLNGELRRKGNEFVYGIPIPRFAIFSVTWECNLRCSGCYARNYEGNGELGLDDIRRIVQECCDLGTYLFVIAGGEPLRVPELIETLSKEERGFFFLFTNGTVLTDDHCRQLAASANILPIISLEADVASTDRRRGAGVGVRVDAAMKRLADASVPFGFSAMISHTNVAAVTSREWFDAAWDKGARFGYMIDYVPVSGMVDESLELTTDDRALKRTELAKRVEEARPLIINFPPDEYVEGECQAAGKGFIHINADGFVEPCPFCHYASDNICEKSLEEILDSAFFRRVRSFTADVPNAPGVCAVVAHRKELERIAAETGARKTESIAARHLGSVALEIPVCECVACADA